MDDQLQVLLIEDNPGDCRLIQELLKDSKLINFNLVCAGSLGNGFVQLQSGKFDVVLLDLSLPDSFGLETLISVRRNKPDVTVIVMTGTDDEALGLQATQAGAQDYLVKGRVSSWLLIRSIRYAIERKRFEARLEYMATHDDLTGLPNRQMFNYTLGLALERSRRVQHSHLSGSKVAVMLLDLDNFKQINDTFGHLEGDKLLSAVAALASSLPSPSKSANSTSNGQPAVAVVRPKSANDPSGVPAATCVDNEVAVACVLSSPFSFT